MNQTNPTPQVVAPHSVPMRQPMLTKLADSTALTSHNPFGSSPPIPSVQPIQKIASITPAAAVITEPTPMAKVATSTDDNKDPALLVGLSLWTARQHEAYLARAAASDNVAPHRYPTVLTDTLRRHADGGDATCRLVLDWLLARGIAETGAGSTAREGAV